jgi:hypothetical protein
VRKNKEPFRDQGALQLHLSPAPIEVIANVDHRRFTQVVDDLGQLLRSSGLEELAIEMVIENHPGAGARARARLAGFAVQALRQESLRHLRGLPALRPFSIEVAGNPHLAAFCGLLELDGVRRTSKSTMDRRSKLFSEEQLRRLHRCLTEVCGNADLCGKLGLEEPLDMGTCLIDGTCLEANIHFPVDWVLLRDVAVTLLKATKLIRAEGLVCRMPEGPDELARQMNRLCIAMTHAKRRKDAKRERKALLRQMKPFLRRIGAHAARHRDKLEAKRPRTRFSQKEAAGIIARVDKMLRQIDPVIEQAHERLIGERAVPTKKKILSVHEPDVQVIVRGKAGKAVEFGNTLLLSENRDGYLTDWMLYRESAPSEPKQLKESLARQNAYDLDKPVEAVSTDRGFASKATCRLLEGGKVYDATCPRDPATLAQRMEEKRFVDLQRRRGSTEARVAILGNWFLGRRLRSKGFGNRARSVAHAVLAHNLWVLARRLAAMREEDAARARRAA